MGDLNENVTVNEEETGAEPKGKPDETKAEKFVRLAEYRVNKAMGVIVRLGNLANRGSYEYTPEQVDAMFATLEDGISEARAMFSTAKSRGDRVFSFGTGGNAQEEKQA